MSQAVIIVNFPLLQDRTLSSGTAKDIDGFYGLVMLEEEWLREGKRVVERRQEMRIAKSVYEVWPEDTISRSRTDELNDNPRPGEDEHHQSHKHNIIRLVPMVATLPQFYSNQFNPIFLDELNLRDTLRSLKHGIRKGIENVLSSKLPGSIQPRDANHGTIFTGDSGMHFFEQAIAPATRASLYF